MHASGIVNKKPFKYLVNLVGEKKVKFDIKFGSKEQHSLPLPSEYQMSY